jgi:hypothetical protein
VRLSHSPARTLAMFDDPNLVSCSGLVPVMALAERCGLSALVRQNLTITARTGVNADLKAPCLVAGMAAAAGSIDDMDVLRHGAMGTPFDGVRAPSTLGSFLRSFTWGNVRQLESAGRVFLERLAAAAPLLPGRDVLAFIDIDSMQKRVYGHAKAGAAFGPAPPGRWPGGSTAGPAARPSAATSSPSRPGSPGTARPDHPAPAPGLAPRAGMAEPVRCLLHAARPGGLTSPEPVTAPSTAPAATIKPGASRTRTSRRTASGTTAMPRTAPRSPSARSSLGNDHPNLRG